MKEIIESLSKMFSERLSSRYLGYLSLCVLIKNYKIVLIVISNDLLTKEKIQLIQDNFMKWNKVDLILSIIILFVPIILIVMLDSLSLLNEHISFGVYKKRIEFLQKKNEYKSNASNIIRENKINSLIIEDPVKFEKIRNIFPISLFEKIDSGNVEIKSIVGMKEQFNNIIRLIDETQFYDKYLVDKAMLMKQCMRNALDESLMNSPNSPISQKMKENIRNFKDAYYEMMNYVKINF